MQISVKSNIEQAIAKLNQLSPRQMPFIVSKAINETAKDAQSAVKASLKGTFTLRNSWTEKGIRFKGSNKQNLTAEIFTKDYYMRRQQFGGIKKSLGGAYNAPSEFTGVDIKGRRYRRIAAPDMIAVPMPDLPRTGRGIVRKRDTPAELVGKAFVITSGSDKYLAVRTGRGKSKQVKLYYHLQRQTNVKPRLNMDTIGNKVVQRRFNKHLQDAIEFAFKTLDLTKGR